MTRRGRAGLRLAGAIVAAATAVAWTGCRSAGGLGLSSEDNDPAKIARALALRGEASPDAPTNNTGNPLVFVSLRGNKRENVSPAIAAFDLKTKARLWKVDTGIRSKILVGNAFVAHMDDGGNLVARAVADGAELWRKPVASYLGGTTDAERVYYITDDRSGERPIWYLIALDGATGAELWRADAPGTLGSPAAHRGLVLLPFLKQWLVILDARTGKQVARIRGLDEEITFVRATDKEVYFGSKAGVFRLDDRAYWGQRGLSTYGRAKFPDEFVRSHYYWDAFDTIQSGYSAYDRNRVLWRGKMAGKELRFLGDLVVVHTYRFLFAFDANTGELRWAYNHPRYDIVASAHLGDVIGLVSGLGELVALDAETGERRYAAKLDGQVLGATFDAAGWKPREEVEGEAQNRVGVLTSIARDRDARFNDVKRFAVTALASLSGGDVTRDLVELVQNERTPKKLYETAVEVLVSRKEPEGIPHLVAALRVRYDFIEETKPRAVGVIARALGALGGVQLDPALRGAAVESLLFHLREPQTPVPDLVAIIEALGQIGGGAEIAPLSSFVIGYRADPAFSNQTEALAAAIDVLLARGGAAERELVAFVARDGRTQPAVAEYAKRALTQTAASAAPAKPKPGAGGAAPAKPGSGAGGAAAPKPEPGGS